MSCGVGHRHSSDPALLWLWHRPAAVAPIRPLAREDPYALGVAPKSNLPQKSLQIVNEGESVEKGKYSYPVGRNVNWCKPT